MKQVAKLGANQEVQHCKSTLCSRKSVLDHGIDEMFWWRLVGYRPCRSRIVTPEAIWIIFVSSHFECRRRGREKIESLEYSCQVKLECLPSLQ